MRQPIRAIEPLWIAALGAQFIVLGGLLLPRIIRLLGRGGAAETVEWAVWMSLLFVFPLAAWIVGWGVPKVASERAASLLKLALVFLLLFEFAAYASSRATPLLVLAAFAAALVGVLWLRGRREAAMPSRTTAGLALACGMAGWMAGGALVYWQNAIAWMLASPAAIVALALAILIVGTTLRHWVLDDSTTALRATDLLPLGALVAFSFRTFPVVEYYHWGFFIGPIERIRHGGTLLWDTPSQYGFLNILIASLFPGSAWQSFWLLQSVIYAIVGCLMYIAIRRISRGWYGGAFAFLITFTTLFFRPRTDSLMLPAQMTPAAGPFRFLWCFVMLAFLVNWHTRARNGKGFVRFAVTGTTIWAIALLWSAEAAIYATAMWFPALLIYSLQEAARSSLSPAKTTVFVLRSALYPLGAISIAALAVVASYKIAGAPGPDVFGHFEYVLLYSSGGYAALPIDPTGTVWYLVLVFLIVSTIAVLEARRDLLDPRLVVWTAVLGGIWAIASYFTGRSHPVNLVALVPFLIFALVGCMRLRPFAHSLNGRYVLAASTLPLLAMPIALIAGHRAFGQSIAEQQLHPARFGEQLPYMDAELQTLLASAGAGPDNSVVLASDGRLSLEDWRGPVRQPVLNSWLPKPFEIIGSLPESRRQVYLDRNAARFPTHGWLIQSKVLTAGGSDHLIRFLESTGRLGQRLESKIWMVTRVQPATTVRP